MGAGKGAIIPWQIGTHYKNHSHHGHAMLLMAVLRDVLQCPFALSTDASPLVMVTAHRAAGHRLVSLMNLSGQLGTAFLPPVPMRNIRISINMEETPVSVRTLCGGESLCFSRMADGALEFTIPSLDLLEVVVVE